MQTSWTKIAFYFIVIFASASILFYLFKLNASQNQQIKVSIPKEQKKLKIFELYSKGGESQLLKEPVFKRMTKDAYLVTYEEILSFNFEKYEKILSENSDMEVIAITHPSIRENKEKCYHAKIDHIHWTLRINDISTEQHLQSKFRKCDFVLDPIAFLLKSKALNKIYKGDLFKSITEGGTLHINGTSFFQIQLSLLKNGVKIYLGDEELSMTKYHAMPTESELHSILEEYDIKRIIYPNKTAELWGCVKSNKTCCTVANPTYPKSCRHVNAKQEWIKTPPCCIKKQIELLEMFVEFTKEFNIDYVIGYGTLLGYQRCKGFIPYDYDIDVMMPNDDFKRMISLRPKLSSRPYKINVVAEQQAHFRFINDDLKYIIDIFAWDKKGKFIYLMNKACQSQARYYPSTKGKFNGIEVKIPKDYIKNLECAYGKEAFTHELIKDEDWKKRKFLKYYKRKIKNWHSSCGYGDTTIDEIGN